MSLCGFQNFLENWHCSIFACIWQILSNHRLTRLKKFILSIPAKLCNYFLFSSIFNTSCICLKIWCGESEKFCKICWELNKALVSGTEIGKTSRPMHGKAAARRHLLSNHEFFCLFFSYCYAKQANNKRSTDLMLPKLKKF